MPFDPQAKALLRNTVLWEKYVSQDQYGDETWADPVEIRCHIDDTGNVKRLPDEVTYVPELTMYFDADDKNVQQFSFRDHFQANGIGVSTLALQPKRINPVYGPLGDAWFVEVTLGGSSGS